MHKFRARNYKLRQKDEINKNSKKSLSSVDFRDESEDAKGKTGIDKLTELKI